MRPQSSKAKGRALQNWVRDKVLGAFPSLTLRDVKSTSMGAGGADVQLSSVAFALFPYSVEAKSRKSFKTIYDFYEQAAGHEEDGEPLLVIKQNRCKPLVVVDAEHFLELVKDRHASNKRPKSK